MTKTPFNLARERKDYRRTIQTRNDIRSKSKGSVRVSGDIGSILSKSGIQLNQCTLSQSLNFTTSRKRRQ
jgi:hypothetical protein